MAPIILENRQAILDLCRRYRVRQLEVFGSATREDFETNRSDVDFLVEFEPLEAGQYADTYFGLLESLQSLLARPVDLVMTSAIRNPYFFEAIRQNRTLIYGN